MGLNVSDFVFISILMGIRMSFVYLYFVGSLRSNTILGFGPWARQGEGRGQEVGGGEQQSSSVEAGRRWVS
jgi:hypothetical protein